MLSCPKVSLEIAKSWPSNNYRTINQSFTPALFCCVCFWESQPSAVTIMQCADHCGTSPYPPTLGTRVTFPPRIVAWLNWKLAPSKYRSRIIASLPRNYRGQNMFVKYRAREGPLCCVHFNWPRMRRNFTAEWRAVTEVRQCGLSNVICRRRGAIEMVTKRVVQTIGWYN